jgi:hypothetical protein
MAPTRGMPASAIVLLLLLFLLFVWLTTPLIESNRGLDNDGVLYAAMAQRATHPDDPNAFFAPWCWRVLTPFLASLLPFDLLGNFKVLAFVTNWLSLLLLYGLLRRLDRPPKVALLGVMLYAGVFWTVKFSFYSPTYIDVQTQTFLLAVLYLMVSRLYWPLPLLLTLGVLQKESLLLLAPVVYVHRGRQEGWFRGKPLLLLITLLLLPLGALWWVRSAIPAGNLYSPLNAYLGNLTEQTTSMRFWPRFVLEIFSGLGILPVLLLYRAKEAGNFLHSHPEWAMQMVIGTLLLFGGEDKGRLFLFMLPALIVTATFLLEPLLSDPTWSVRLWLGVTLVLHFYLGHHLTPMGTVAQYHERLVPLHSYSPLSASLLYYLPGLTVWAFATLFMRYQTRRRSSLDQVQDKG